MKSFRFLLASIFTLLISLVSILLVAFQEAFDLSIMNAVKLFINALLTWVAVVVLRHVAITFSRFQIFSFGLVISLLARMITVFGVSFLYNNPVVYKQVLYSVLSLLVLDFIILVFLPEKDDNTIEPQGFDDFGKREDQENFED